MNFLSTALLSVILIFTHLPENQDKNFMKEDYRPQFHFSTAQNWMGIPGGLVFFEGEYHLFYQYNTNGLDPVSNGWGHASSTDLAHWKQLPLAFSADILPGTDSVCAILSGSVVIDQNNVLQKQTNDNKTLVAFYTAKGCGQLVAYSSDKGNSWEKLEKPVIPFDAEDDARNPKVFWHNETQKWVMLLVRKISKNENSRGVSIYTSGNLVDWEYQNHIPGFGEHPDLIEFTVKNRPNEKKWVLLDGDGTYLLGNFEGKNFTPSSGKMKIDWGSSYYAGQTIRLLTGDNERIIQIASLLGGKFTDMPFNGQLAIPSELSVTKISSGYKLIRKPVSEIEVLHGKHDSWTDKNLIPGINQNKLKKVSGDCLRITGEFDLKTSDNFGFMIRHSNKNPGVEILYNVKRGVLTVLGSTVPLLPINNTLKFDILIDRSSIEIFANDGQSVVSSCFEPEVKSKDVVLFTNGGELEIIQLDVYDMESMWVEK